MITKKTVKAGNSSAVVLPRAWLNKEVRVELVEKTPEIILSDTLNIVKEHIPTEKIIGIYLVGSYARQEQDKNSDFDVLVVTDDLDKEIINQGIYNILIISYQLVNQKLKQNLFPVGPMLKEAKALLNSNYLTKINVSVTKENVKWYLDTTEDKIRLVKRIISELKKKEEKYISDQVIYTAVLRIRTLYIIEKLTKNQNYSKKEFLRIINSISPSAYQAYLNVKNDTKEENKTTVKEAEKLNDYLEGELEKVKRMLK